MENEIFNPGNMIMSAVPSTEIQNGEMVETSAQTLQNVIDNSPSAIAQQMMYYRKTRPQVKKYGRINRNDLCPCGSGLKYKNCCLASGKYEEYEDA